MIHGHGKEVNCCAFNDQYFVTCSGDKSIRVFSAKDFSEKAYSPLNHHKYGVNCVTFNANGNHMASASMDGSAVVWEFLEDGPVIRQILQHSESNTVQVCRFSPNSVMLVTGSSDGAIAVWNLEQRKKLFQFIGHPDGNVNATSFTPCNDYLMTGSGVGDIRVWDLKYKQSCILQTQAHDGVSGCGVDCICFSPSFHVIGDGQIADTYLMATCGQDNNVKLWIFHREIAIKAAGKRNYSSRCLEPLHEMSGHHGPVSNCCFSSDGQKLASSSFDKTVIVWDPVTAVQLYMLQGHSAIVTSVSFSCDGIYLASTSYDKAAIIWKLNDDGDGCSGLVESKQEAVATETLIDFTVSDGPAKVHQWTRDDVLNWLEGELKLTQYSETFKLNEIDGEELLNLDSETLTNELKVGPLGHRNKILRGIACLKSQMSVSASVREKQKGSKSPVFLPATAPSIDRIAPIVTATPNLSIDDKDMPDEFLCPISREVMIDPVIAADGFTYERNGIERWFKRGSNVSPMTNQRLVSRNLIPNQALKTLIMQFLEASH